MAQRCRTFNRMRSVDGSRILAPGDAVTVRLEHGDRLKLTYAMTVIEDDGDHIVVEGPYAERRDRDLGYTTFEVGDWFVEQYWRSRWYSVKEVRGRDGRKGWYCDVARPAVVADNTILSEDLDLDVWVSADFATVLVLDEDEFAASGLEQYDVPAATSARAAVADLVDAAERRSQPFSG